MPDTDVKTRLLEAAKPHVPFDGWSETTLRLAATEAGIDRAMIDAVCPRGAVDLALAYHEAGDAAMVDTLQAADLGEMRFRDRVAFAVRTRLDLVEDRELVRRGMTLFALPQHAADGTGALWRTADHIWTALGDTSRDINWYTKRATLSGVYGATVLYWLGDDSEGHARTWEFLDRRIDDVMQIEKVKAKARENRLVSGLMAGPLGFLGRVKAPGNRQQAGMPGRWRTPN
ncbi:COQ9 family protein [Roseovarius sp. A46]|uniref:COQ9 family protein n=1 Tax=Roseovarius sp. A46 TaxID=2109331 RepID=UPI001012BB90|nr:COQ9 family protein [Roseovarius sp. A46]RXV64762.1 COQ9 family protein [Roseovarius sp. A46]